MASVLSTRLSITHWLKSKDASQVFGFETQERPREHATSFTEQLTEKGAQATSGHCGQRWLGSYLYGGRFGCN